MMASIVLFIDAIALSIEVCSSTETTILHNVATNYYVADFRLNLWQLFSSPFNTINPCCPQHFDCLSSILVHQDEHSFEVKANSIVHFHNRRNSKAGEPGAIAVVETKENPSDLCSKGLPTSHFKHSTFWWRGPDFLAKDELEWP